MIIKKLTGNIGAELLKVDISKDLSEQKISDIRGALLEHKVIFFRNQLLTPEQHINFAKKFGPISQTPVYQTLDSHPEIMAVVKEPSETNVIGDTWHTDETYQETPPLGSLLYAREVPRVGGDTLFSDLYLAYEMLSESLKLQLNSLFAIHSNNLLDAKARNKTRSTKLRENVGYIESTHPVVRTHDETGKKLLFVNRPFTTKFQGMTHAESQPLLNFLYEHSSKPEFTCRFRWEKHSLAFWDNRCTMHYAINDYPGERREMHRITIQGSRPK